MQNTSSNLIVRNFVTEPYLIVAHLENAFICDGSYNLHFLQNIS